MKATSVGILLGLALAPGSSLACLLPEERAGLPRLERKSRMARSTQANGLAIGTGDRYDGGTIAPRGVGSQTTTLTSILNVDEITSGMEGLANVYGITTFTTPYTTYEGNSIIGGLVGGNGTCTDAYRVYFNANIHARERGAADGLLYFIGDLLYAQENGVGLKYGAKSYTNAQVLTALSTGIVFVPLSNPDGTAYDQSSNACWRKNRNPESATGSGTGSDDSIGVDLNRNFDFIWDFENLMAPSVAGSASSDDPSDETFHGTAAFSEPETKSVKWVLDTYSKVRWFIDMHSYTGDVLYSWGSDTDQSTTKTQNFMNSAYDSVRGIIGDTAYREYTPAQELADNKAAATKIGAGMSAAASRSYSVIPAAELYPTSGASDDYSYSRHFADTSLNLVHAYTVEFGFGNSAVSSCPFYPSASQHNYNMQEIGAGYMEALLAAINIGLGTKLDC